MASSKSASTEVPSHRACIHCRSQKIRCIIDDSNPDICQRCARSGKTCVFTPMQRRKQRKRTDTRVAELEREMRAMRALLDAKEGEIAQSKSAEHGIVRAVQRSTQRVDQAISLNSDPSKHITDSQTPNEDEDHFIVSADLASRQMWPTQLPDWPEVHDRDFIDRGIISMATARQLVDTYRKTLFPHYPFMPIPESVTADELRRQQPTLFLAVVAAAAGGDDAPLAATLYQEVLRVYADRSMVRSEKSLELVQALLVSCIWHHPPSKFGQLKYYEHIHIACAMAMDIGIGTRPSNHRGRFGQSHSGRKTHEMPVHPVHPLEDVSNPDLSMTPRSRTESPDTASAGSRRTLLGCYVSCAVISLSLRRPNTMRATTYIRECVDCLERRSDNISTDQQVVAWTRLIMIVEDISTAFSYDDPGSIASIAELKTQVMIKDFGRRLTEWHMSVARKDFHGALAMIYWNVRMYLHEVVLHIDHLPQDFMAPYQMGGISPREVPDLPSAVLASAVAECIDGAHQILSAFMKLSPEGGRSLPVFGYVRNAFASFVLAKLCLSAAHPRSNLQRVLDRSSIQAESFIDRAILHVRNVIGSTKCRVPSIFLALLFKLRQWSLNPHLIDPEIGSIATTELKFGHSQNHWIDPNSIIGRTITETQSSSDDRTPQSIARDDSTGDHSPPTQLLPQASPVSLSTEQTTRQDNVDYKVGPENAYNTEAVNVGNSTYLPVHTSWQASDDAMKVDQAYLQLLSNIDSVPPGGLTGLDDWSNSTSEAIGLGDNLNWSNMSLQSYDADNTMVSEFYYQ